MAPSVLRTPTPQAMKSVPWHLRLGVARLLYLAGREHPVSPLLTYSTYAAFSVGIERSTPNQSILDAPTGTNQANGSRLDAVPSHPFSIYKTGLAYNEKHYLPPGHITLPAAPNGGVIECGAEEWSNYTNSIFTLEDHLSWQSEEINHRRALVWDKIPRHHLIMGDKEPIAKITELGLPVVDFECVCVYFPLCVYWL